MREADGRWGRAGWVHNHKTYFTEVQVKVSSKLYYPGVDDTILVVL